jgi:predicted GIY-YIG superfamily endonuclease
MPSHVYVLGLAEHRIYVGFSDDLCCRIAQHFAGRGALWTRKYRPQTVLEVVEGDKAMEDAKTIQHMMLLWPQWDLVRGGKWCDEYMRLPPLPIRKTWTIRPPKPLEDSSWETVRDHLLSVTRNSETGPNAFKARISGRKASEACPVRGIKTIYATSEEDARTKALAWIGQEDADDGPTFFSCSIEKDDSNED